MSRPLLPSLPSVELGLVPPAENDIAEIARILAANAVCQEETILAIQRLFALQEEQGWPDFDAITSQLHELMNGATVFTQSLQQVVAGLAFIEMQRACQKS